MFDNIIVYRNSNLPRPKSVGSLAEARMGGAKRYPSIAVLILMGFAKALPILLPTKARATTRKKARLADYQQSDRSHNCDRDDKPVVVASFPTKIEHCRS
jgi:hypothetical protein